MMLDDVSNSNPHDDREENIDICVSTDNNDEDNDDINADDDDDDEPVEQSFLLHFEASFPLRVLRQELHIAQTNSSLQGVWELYLKKIYFIYFSSLVCVKNSSINWFHKQILKYVFEK